jgi:hypothetical protein
VERFTLVDMQFIEYAWYRVKLHLLPSTDRELVGDMKFSVHICARLVLPSHVLTVHHAALHI